MTEPTPTQPLTEIRRVVYRPLRASNALEETIARIVETVRLGVVGPGESLPAERELASRYGVSRDTIREAIRELSDAGYLVRVRGRYGGTFVADPLPRSTATAPTSTEELEDVLGVRRVIESGAAREAARRSLSAEARAELWARYEAAKDAGQGDYRRLDTLLHLTIAELSGVPSLVALTAENRARVNAWLDEFPLLRRNIDHSNAQHETIVTSILAGRSDLAEAAVLDHLAGSEALIRGFVGSLHAR
jgi:DNA-binding FadR family transcriptional regulator